MKEDKENVLESQTSNSRKEERAYNALEDYRNRSKDNAFYSMQRIDLVIVSLSSGSIFALMKFTEEIKILKCFELKLLWFFALVGYSLAIVLNIFSQIASHKSNSTEARWAADELEKLNDLRTKNSIGDNLEDENRTLKYNKWSYIILIMSTLLALILLGIITFWV